MTELGPLPNLVTPWKDESAASIIVRLADANYHESHRLIENEVNVPPRKGKFCANLLSDQEQLERLSALSGIDVMTLRLMTVHTFAPVLQGAKQSGGDDMTHALLSPAGLRRFANLTFAKYCRRCLLLDGLYHRQRWDLLLVTACIEHHTLLVDTCPRGRRITHVDVVRGNHGCGSNLLREASERMILDDRDGLEAQSHLQRLLGTSPFAALSPAEGPPFDLSSAAFFHLLECFSNLLCGIVDRGDVVPIQEQLTEKLSRKAWSNSMSNLCRHVLLRESFKILKEWPVRFYAFLDSYRRIGRDTYFAGLSREYRPLQLLLNRLRGTEFAFVHEAFKKYLTHRWTGGTVRKGSRFNGNGDADQRQYVGIEEAATMLGITYAKTVALVRLKTLESITVRVTSRRIHLVSRRSIEALAGDLTRLLTVREVAKRLHTRVAVIHELIRTGFIGKRRLTHQWWLVPEGEVESFEDKFLAGPHGMPHDSFHFHSLALTRRTSQFTSDVISKLLHFVDVGVLSTDVRQGVGLGGISFNPLELNRCELLLTLEDKRIGDLSYAVHNVLEYALEPIQGRGKQVLFSVLKAAKLIGVPRPAFEQLRALGALGEPKRGLVTGEAVVEFRSRYMSLPNACVVYRLRRNLLFGWLRKGKLSKTLVLSLGGRSSYLLDRSELVDALRLHSIPLSEAAQILHADASSVQNLIMTSVLRVVRGANNKLFAVRSDLFLLTKRMNETLSVEQLANELGVDSTHLTQLIEEGVLPLHSKAKVFTGVDLLILEGTHGAAKTAEILNVSSGAVIKWMRAGRLRAVSGPGIDDERGYSFRMIDIRAFDYKRNLELSRGKKRLRLKADAMAIDDIAALLELRDDEAFRLVTLCMKPVGGPGIDGRIEYLFPKDEVLRLKARRDDNIVSAVEAASILGAGRNHFHQTYVETKLLIPVPYENGKGKYFFLRRDVEALAESIDKALTVDKAASALQINPNTIRKWIRTGRLRAISGPRVNGRSTYLLDPKDVQAKRRTTRNSSRR